MSPVTFVAAAVLVCAASAPPSGTAKIPDEAVTILDCTGTYWRWMKASRPAVVAAEGGAAERVTIAGKTIDAATAGRTDPPLPAEWAQPDFDDTSWPRTAGRWLDKLVFIRTSMNMHTGTVAAYCSNAVLCLRGRFAVTDPAAVEALYLSLTYRGGAVVYLNGKEVARRHLPAGKLTPATPAEALSLIHI